MDDLTRHSVLISRIWGSNPTLADLVACAAVLDHRSTAFVGRTGPIAFGELSAQVAATAELFAGQGLDLDAAVGAVVTPAVATGLNPAETAAHIADSLHSIRNAAFELIGSDDLGSLPGIFRSVVARCADRPAVTDLVGGCLTYAELDAWSDDVAAGLISLGAGPGVLVGVALPRTVDLVVGLLGVVKSGAAYLPLDQSHPIDRLSAIVVDAAPVVVLTDPTTVAAWTDLDVPKVTLDAVVATTTPDAVAAIPSVVDTRHPAYVMYTSGSTGRPKGVVVTHADVVTLLRALGTEYDFSADDVWSMFQSYAFDVSVGEMWVALAFGGRLVVLDYETTRMPERFAEVLAVEGVTIVNLTPSAFYQLAGALRDPARRRLARSVRVMIFVGEALDFTQVRHWFVDRRRIDGDYGPQLNNMYGPTEATVYMTRRLLTPQFVEDTAASNVGVALPGSQMYVLDARMASSPDGVPGDLYLAGDQLARGYSGRPGLTAARFVADPFGVPGARMYRSGDVAVVRDGSVEYLRRADDQVKVRGFRVELGDVEAALLAADSVDAAAAAIKSRVGFADHLVGYVVGGPDLDVRAIRSAAAAKVPAYMVPDIVMVLDRLPLNVNGKLDRNALPTPVITVSEPLVPPDSDVEHVLAQIVAEVLGLDEVSVVESVFDLGANSLLAARIVGRACDALGVELNLRDLFDAPTVRLLARLSAHAQAAMPPVVAPESRPAQLPLSFAQQRIWFINQFDPESATYNIPLLVRLSGRVDVPALRTAVTDVVTRHEVLRTVFPEHDGVPRQEICAASRVDDELDWDVVESYDALVEAVTTGFELTSQWPIRVRLLVEGAGEYLIALVVHHIAADGESMGPLLSDVVAAYSARVAGQAPTFSPLPVQFADYALWEHDVLGSATDPESILARQLNYWRKQLVGLPDVVELPADAPRPAIASRQGDRVPFEIPADLGGRISALAQVTDCTPFMVVHAAFAVLLARLSATDDIAVATPVAGRGQAALDHLVGMFVNTLVLRVRVDPSTRFTDLLAQVRTVDLDGFAYGDAPFEAVVQALDPVRSEAFSPLTQVMLSFDPAAAAHRLDFAVDGVRIQAVDAPSAPAQWDLSVIVSSGDAGEPWTGSAVFATDLFDRTRVEGFVDAFLRLLDSLTADPAHRVGDVALIPEHASAAMAALERGPRFAPTARTLADAVITADPSDPAVWFVGRTMNYGEFASRVNALARELIDCGVGPDVAVGVAVDRSVELIVAIHAVITAGGCYVPMDLSAPADRIATMVDTAGARLILVPAGAVPDAVVSLGESIPLVAVDTDGPLDPTIPAVTDADRRAPLHPDSAAYTLFTSGSTGRPKGVTVSHRAAVNRLEWMRQRYSLSRDEVFLQKTPSTFDVSVWEFFLPLALGARLVVAEPGRHGDADYLARLIGDQSVSVIHFVPSMLAAFVDVVGERRLAALNRLNWVFSSGEALSAPPAQRLAALTGSRLVNLYGPTEAAVDVTAHELSASDRTVPIGVPMWNTHAVVLDTRLQRVPDGVVGELYLGGVQLARGYAHAGTLTAERFVADPYGDVGARLYRTGDLVRRRADGALEYLGRNDFQVKLRGQRIELGEVEAAIALTPGVVHVAAAVVAGTDGAQHLVGYVAPPPGDFAAVEAVVRSAVPIHMVPSRWVGVDDVALTSSGKLDRSELPAPDFGSHAGGRDEHVEPHGDVEVALADVFAGVLGVARVSAVESFFAAGGNSLSALKVAARAAEALGVEVSVREVFAAPSVRELAVAVARADTRRPSSSLGAAPRPAHIPLSPAQQRIWFLNRLAADEATYNIPVVLTLIGTVDASALHAAAIDVVARHEVLRTVYPSRDGMPEQVIASADRIAGRLDWAVISREADLLDALTRGFDVAREWPLRIRLWESAPSEYVLAVVVHHIAGDGESLRPLVTDLVTAYSARVRGRAPGFVPLPVQFADYAVWHRAQLGELDDPNSVGGRQLEYWTDRLAGLPDLLELPTDRPRPHEASHRGAQVGFEIPAHVADRVGGLARDRDVTSFIVVHGAVAVLLARLTAADQVAVAAPVSARGPAALDPLIGMFVNTVVLRADVDPAQDFHALLEQLRVSDIEAFAHADVPFEVVVDAVAPVRSAAFAPLAQVMLSFDPNSSVAGADITVDGIGFAVQTPPVVGAQLDLSVVVESAAPGEPWTGSIVYATELFDEDTVACLADRFVRILDGLTDVPTRAVGDVEYLTDDESGELERVGSGPMVQLPEQALGDLVAAQVARTPTSTALWFAGRDVSYAEFGARVNQLARQLVSLGVGVDDVVGVGIGRSIELAVAVHAVVVAGAQYVPIDPAAPPERIRYMVASAGVTVVLATDGAFAGMPVTVVNVDADCSLDDPASTGPATERFSATRPDSAVYTLFTSGSTGRPKGVTLTHRAIINRLSWMHERYSLTADDVFLQKTPSTFDVSVWELFLPLTIGAQLVIADPSAHGDPQVLASTIAERGVTVVHFVPSMLSAFLDVVARERLAELTTLTWLFTSGEALSTASAHTALGLGSLRVANLYGPTEAAIDVTAYEVTGAEVQIPIGEPVPNTSTRVLDRRLRPVPAGVSGELYLGGVQLARGYSGQPRLTAERFVADPFGAPGARLYRTGDLVRRNAAGQIDFLGRTDFQVKLRGQRIELGEIEACLMRTPGVVKAAATIVEAPSGGGHVVAYLSPASVDIDAAKAVAARELLTYMRPSVWMVVDDIVVNSSGKLDRSTLPAPEFGDAAAVVEPVGVVESAIADVFAAVLGMDEVSVVESFFELGGNSLSATRAVARVSEALGARITVQELFAAPSVRGLAATVDTTVDGLPPVERIVPRPEQIPLSLAQRRMWFLNRFDPSAVYNVPLLVRLSGAIDGDALRTAVLDVIARHEVLRTSFPSVGGVPMQLIGATDEFDSRDVWRVVPSETELIDEMSLGFDVTEQWPIRVRLWPTDSSHAMLAMVLHHIGADGESLLPLASDVIAAYAARARGSVPEFEPLPVQFADFAIWQHDVLGSTTDPESVLGRQYEYWREQLAGLPDILELPTDHARPAVASHRGGIVDFEIPAQVAKRIGELARSCGATPFMVVHAGFAVLLAALSAGDDIAVATPVAGRGQADLDPLVGMFVNTLVLRTRVDPATSFEAFIAGVRAVAVDAFMNADLPFEAVVEAVGQLRSQAFSPLAQVMLSFDPGASIADADLSVDGVQIVPIVSPIVTAQVDLSVVVKSAGDGQPWQATAVYATDLFDESTVTSMMAAFVRALTGLTDDPGSPLGDVPLIGAAELRRLDAYGRGPRLGLAETTAAQMFADRIASTPDRVALRARERSMTYRELGARVSALAADLVDSGVRPESAVGICIPRSMEMIVAVHAVISVGGHFVPIAVDAPPDRMAYLIDVAAVTVVLVSERTVAPTQAIAADVRRIVVDADDPSALVRADVGGSQAPVRPDNAAYTMFTSGSTGRPKGVTVSHRALMAHLTADQAYYQFDDEDVVLQVLEFTFDPSVLEFYRPVMSGGELVLLDPGDHRDPVKIADVVRRRGVTSACLVPSMLAAMIDVLDDDPSWARTLTRIHTGGEALSPALAELVRARWPHSALFNQYGPTETTTYSTVARVEAGRTSVPIGEPVANATVSVRNSRLGRTAIGVVGELYVGGSLVGRAYASRPGLTAARFVADPLHAGQRMYRTGDLVRWTAAGELEFLGRSDFQVKLRGQRLELEEVEAALFGAPGVVHAAAMVRSSDRGAEHLVGYLVPATVDIDEVSTAVGRVLPPFMVPTTWVRLDNMPLNAAGKVDRWALPAPDFGVVDGTDFAAPEGARESAVARVFADLLGVDEMSATTSFFEAGGNSLTAMRLAAQASDALGVRVSVREVFEAPTVRALAAALAGAAPQHAPIHKAEPRPEQIPLSFAQRRMWFVNQLNPSSGTYNIPILLRLTGELDLDALYAAFVDVVERHEILRTTFPSRSGVPRQNVGRASVIAAKLDWDVVDDADYVYADAMTGFDLTKRWPIRVRVVELGAGQYLLAVVLHHIAADGESLGPLIVDLVTAYTARLDGQAPGLPALPFQYADFALWQRAALGSADDADSIIGGQLDYWRAHLSGLPELVELPQDRPRPAVAGGAGAQLDFTLPAELGAQLTAYATEAGVTQFTVAHAVLAVLVARLTGTSDIVIGTPFAGRAHTGLDGLVGMFVNTLALRVDVRGSATFDEVVVAARQSDLDGFSNADVAFDEVVEALAPIRSSAFAPFTQVWLTLDQTALPELAGADLAVGGPAGMTITPVVSPQIPAKVDLVVAIRPAVEGPWQASMIYATDIFDESTVCTFADQFTSILSAVLAEPTIRVDDVALPAVTRRDQRTSSGTDADTVRQTADDVGLGVVVARAGLRFGTRPAIVDADGVTVSYAELDRRSTQLARLLIERGVGPETVVAVVLGRSAQQVIAIVAAAKAGAGWLPIDPALDGDRRRRMLIGWHADVGLARGPRPADLDAVPTWIDLDDPLVESAVADRSVAPIDEGQRTVPHRAGSIAALVADRESPDGPLVALTGSVLGDVGRRLAHLSGADEYSRILAHARVDSVDALLEMLTAVTAGGALVCRPPDAVDGQALHDVVTGQAISQLFVSAEVLATLDSATLPLLRSVYVSGAHRLPAALLDEWTAARRTRSYEGPAALAGLLAVSSATHVEETEAAAVVLDDKLRPVPAGDAGDLYVTGPALARGAADARDTATMFVAYEGGTRIYRTGERVRWVADGAGERRLEFLDRTSVAEA